MKLIIKIDGKAYRISRQTHELISKLFIISEQPKIYYELKAYQGVGKAQSQLLAQALANPINYPQPWKQ